MHSFGHNNTMYVCGSAMDSDVASGHPGIEIPSRNISTTHSTHSPGVLRHRGRARGPIKT